MLQSGGDWYVVCLCAQWCGTCRAYFDGFMAQQSAGAPMRYCWVDVEDAAHADLLANWEIETFPTLLIAQGQRPVFMGVLPPQLPVLQRLVHSCMVENAAPVGVDAAVQALWTQLQPRLAVDGA